MKLIKGAIKQSGCACVPLLHMAALNPHLYATVPVGVFFC